MVQVHSKVWLGYRNRIQVLDPRLMCVEASFDAHPRKESQVSSSLTRHTSVAHPVVLRIRIHIGSACLITWIRIRILIRIQRFFITYYLEIIADFLKNEAPDPDPQIFQTLDPDPDPREMDPD